MTNLNHSPSTEEIRQLANASAARAGAMATYGEHNPAPRPSDAVHAALLEPLSRWVRVKQAPNSGDPGATGLERAMVSLDLLDRALTRLGDRKGDREDAARSWLEERREAIAKAVAVVESIGADFTGPRAQELAGRIASVRVAFAQASHAVAEATHETIAAARDALDRAGIDARDLDRDIAAVIESLRLPEFPQATVFDSARHDTADLEALPAKNPPPSLIARAINQGLGKQAVEEKADAQAALTAAMAEERALTAALDREEADAIKPESVEGGDRKAALAEQAARASARARVHAACAEKTARAGAAMTAAPSVRRLLWAIYETQPDHELIKWRARAAAER